MNIKRMNIENTKVLKKYIVYFKLIRKKEIFSPDAISICYYYYSVTTFFNFIL